MSRETVEVCVPLEELSPILTSCLQEGQEIILTITGNSMSPLLRHRRDQVVLAAVDGAQLQPGDVPLYRRRNGDYVLHRVIARDDGACCVFIDSTEVESTRADGGVRYTMLGDAQTELEHGIMPSQIVARAVAFIRRGKRVSCDGAAYHRYVRWWYWWLFARPQLLFLYRLPSRMRRYCRRVFSK